MLAQPIQFFEADYAAGHLSVIPWLSTLNQQKQLDLLW